MKVADRPRRRAMARAGERVLVRGDSPATRWIASVAVLCILGWLIVLCVREHQPADWHGAGRLGWVLALLAAAVLIAAVPLWVGR